MRLANKTAIVTGGAHGIGRAIAELFAEEGARVLIADLDSKAGENVAATLLKAGGKAEFVKCDVERKADVTRTVKRAMSLAGSIDVLCNNAAYISDIWHSAGDAPEAEWERSFRVSLMGAQYFTQAVLPIMTRQRGGSIINISSIQ